MRRNIIRLAAAWILLAVPVWAGDTSQPPVSVARDIEIINRLLQQRQASQPTQPQQPATVPGTDARIAKLIAGLGEDTKDAREKARAELVKIGGPAVPSLIMSLDDPAPRVRIEAAKALGTLREPRAAEPLVGLIGDPAKELWGAVSGALLKIGPPAVPYLLDALEETDATVRWRTVRTLGSIRAPGVAEALIGLLNKDRSTGVRVEIATALGKIKDRTACDALLDALHDW